MAQNYPVHHSAVSELFRATNFQTGARLMVADDVGTLAVLMTWAPAMVVMGVT